MDTASEVLEKQDKIDSGKNENHYYGLRQLSTHCFNDDLLDILAHLIDGSNRYESFFDPSGPEDESYKKYKNIILVLGNTGCGKTIFTQWIAGDNDKLISKEIAKDTGEYLIEYNDDIDTCTIKSKAIFPELVINNKTGTIYCDFPDISDTRDTITEIAIRYFTKKILHHADGIKIIFTVTYSSVRKGVDRHTFMQSLRHITDFVQDINKYQNSIAIVITKVDNNYVKQGGNLNLVKDNQVVAFIFGFLKELKQDLEERVNHPDVFGEEREFYENAKKIIGVLLAKEGEQYSRIGLFRRPDIPGLISKMSLLQEQKHYINRIIHENLNFSLISDSDFGYTISDICRNDINYLIETISRSLLSSISNIAENIQKNYCDLVEKTRNTIKSFFNSRLVVDVDQSEAETFLHKINKGQDAISKLTEALHNLSSPEELHKNIKNCLISLDIDLYETVLLNIEKQAKCFKILQVVSDRSLNTRPWTGLFQRILTYLSESRKHIEDDVNHAAEELKIRIRSNLNNIAKAIQDHCTEKMKLFKIQERPDILRTEQDKVIKMKHEIKDQKTLGELVQTIHSIALSLGISIPQDNMQDIAYQEKQLEFLQMLSNKELNVVSLVWVCPFEDALKYRCELEK